MKKKLLTIALLLCGYVGISQSKTNIALIPQPVSLTANTGKYVLQNKININVSSQLAEVKSVANLLKSTLHTATGFPVTISSSGKADITLQINQTPNKQLGQEGYELKVTPQGVQLAANAPAGLFYGIQTIFQLLPREIVSKTAATATWEMPAVTIVDYPRVGWRGLMLDVARHFFTKQQVKDFIDHMVAYKYNMLHLHLTDDQGWRIEIKSLPQLTAVGAWRASRTGRWGEFTKPSPDEPKDYGGYYTQEDIKELLAYAKERFVTVLPEIDVPGHSMALVAAMSELSCTPGTYQVNAGDKFMIWEGNGKFYGITDNTLCPANEKVYEVLDKVFTEVAALFPFEYIHMGGDEAYKGYWEKSDAVKALMQRENLKDMHEVQSYFVKRVAKIIESKGKKMMGWDEILEGGIADNAAIMSWRGAKGGIEAAKMKHPVVMSPNTHTYVDLYQGDPIAEPPTYSMLRLSQSYKFDPIPEGVDPSYILGGQANLWSERLYTVRHAEYMLWPRAFAVAECLWSPLNVKNWDNFVQRTEQHFKRYDVAEINYSRSMYDPVFAAKRNADSSITITLSTEVKDLAIHYSFDEFFPDKFYPAYTSPLTVPKDAANLRVITYRNGVPVGKMITMPIAELKKRAR